jgi:C-terminal processing protease CtpA/Prc
MRTANHILIVMLIAVASQRTGYADPTAITASVDSAEVVKLFATTTDSLEEPIGMRIDRADPVLAKVKLATGDVIRAINGRASTGKLTLTPADGSVLYLDVLRGKQLLVVRLAIKPPTIGEVRIERGWIVDHLDAMRGTAPVRVLAQVTRAGKPSGVALSTSWTIFEPGDVIRSIDGATVTTLEQAANAFDKAKDKPSIVIKLERLDQPMTFKLAIEKGMTDELQAKIDTLIKRIDDTHYELDKALVDEILASPMVIAKGARVVPAMKDGKARGIKLYAIRPSSIFAKLGLTNGDTVVAINGFPLTSADKALEVYTKIRQAKLVVFDIERRGKPLTLAYAIR